MGRGTADAGRSGWEPSPPSYWEGPLNRSGSPRSWSCFHSGRGTSTRPSNLHWSPRDLGSSPGSGTCWLVLVRASHFPPGGLCLLICGRSPRRLNEMSPVQCLPFPCLQRAMPPGFPRACLPCSQPQEPQLWAISTLDSIRSTLGPQGPDTEPVAEEEGSKGIPSQALSSSLSFWGEEWEDSGPL